MKSPSIFLAIFVLLVPFLTFAQQTQRTSTPEQVLGLHQGRLTEFENYTHRFEVAYQENDLQSMGDIRVELVKIMVNELKANQKVHHENPSDEHASTLFKNQKQLLTDFAAEKIYTLNDLPENLKIAPFLTTLNTFREEMTGAIQAMEKTH